MAWAVSAITGIFRVASLALIRRVASQPSITGRLMSIRMRSGNCDVAISTPCCPSMAIDTSKPLRTSRRESMSRFISLSSTSKIFAMLSPLLFFHARSSVGDRLRLTGGLSCQASAHDGGEFSQIRLIFGDDSVGLPAQDAGILPGQILRGHHNDR